MVRLNILNLLLLIAYPLHGLRINSPGARWVRNNVRTQLYSTKEATATVQLAEGEIVKAIITKGQGRKVEAGDILAVEYSAYVQGSNKPFAKGDKEKFTFKDGSMIRGWDISIGSMKVGEKAKFICSSKYGYGEKGVSTVIPPNAKIEFEINLLAWLGNQLRPETLFEKDLDIDPFIASTPEAIQQEFDTKQQNQADQYEGSIIDIYIRRFKKISFGFGGSGFFTSQSGERPPWYLNPNLTFPLMILFVISLFSLVFTTGGVKEKGGVQDIELSSLPLWKYQIEQLLG